MPADKLEFVGSLGSPNLFFKYAVGNGGENRPQLAGRGHRSVLLELSFESCASSVELVDTLQHYWDYAFMAGPAVAVRSAHGDPRLFPEASDPSQRPHEARVVSALSDAIKQTRDVSGSVMELANELLKTASHRSNCSKKTWYVALKQAQNADAQGKGGEFFGDKNASRLMDEIALDLVDDGTPSLQLLETFYLNHDKKLLHKWAHNTEFDVENIDKCIASASEKGVLMTTNGLAAAVQNEAREHTDGDYRSTLEDAIGMLKQLRMIKTGAWRLSSDPSGPISCKDEAYSKFVVVQGYLLAERALYTNIFDPVLWCDLPLSKFSTLYTHILVVDRAVAPSRTANDGNSAIYAVDKMPGDDARRVLTRFEKPVRFFDRQLCERMGLHQMPIDEYVEVDEDFDLDKDLPSCLDDVIVQRVKFMEAMYKTSISLAMDAALYSVFPKKVKHDGHVVALAKGFWSSLEKRRAEALTAEHEKTGWVPHSDSLRRRMKTQSGRDEHLGGNGWKKIQWLSNSLSKAFEGHKDWMSYVPKEFHSLVGVDDAKLFCIAQEFVPKDHPFHTHLVALQTRPTRPTLVSPLPPLPPPNPPPPPPTNPPPPPPKRKAPEIGFVSVAAAGGREKVFGTYREPSTEKVWEVKNPGQLCPDQQSDDWETQNGYPIMVYERVPEPKGNAGMHVCLLLRESPGEPIRIVSRDNNKMNIPLDWKVTEEQLKEEPKKKQPGKKARKKAREAAAAAAAPPVETKEVNVDELLAKMKKLELEKEEQRKAAEVAKQEQDCLKDALHKAERERRLAINDAALAAERAELDAAVAAADAAAAAALSATTAAAEAPERNEDAMCVVCMDAPKTWAMVPCHHLCLCEDCAEQILSTPVPKCPMCNGVARGPLAIRIFGA